MLLNSKRLTIALMSIVISALAICVHIENENVKNTETEWIYPTELPVASPLNNFVFDENVTVVPNENENKTECIEPETENKVKEELEEHKDESEIIKEFHPEEKLASNGKPYVYYEVWDVRDETGFYHMKYELQEYTYERCIQYGIEEYFPLILCQFFYESGYRSVISKTNDWGIAQINKCNHKWLAKELGITDFLDPKQSIHCGVYLMSKNLKKYDVQTALFCYNTGKTKGSNKYSKNVMFMWNYGYREILK